MEETHERAVYRWGCKHFSYENCMKRSGWYGGLHILMGCNGNCVFTGEIVCPACRHLKYASFDTVVFTLGYPKKDDMTRRIAFKIEDIEISEGKEEWGAEPGKVYFVIKLGERLC